MLLFELTAYILTVQREIFLFSFPPKVSWNKSGLLPEEQSIHNQLNKPDNLYNLVIPTLNPESDVRVHGYYCYHYCCCCCYRCFSNDYVFYIKA